MLPRLRSNGHSFLLSSYLSRIGRIENPSCSACEHSSQEISHLILHSPTTDSLRRSLFGHSLSLYDLWSRPLGVARLKESGKQQHQQPKCMTLNGEFFFADWSSVCCYIGCAADIKPIAKHEFVEVNKT